MARRANRKKVGPYVSKPRKHETLEDRVVMSADPLGGPMMSTHGFADVEEVPSFTHHGLVETTVEAAPIQDPNADFWSGTGDAFDLGVDDTGQRVEQTLAQAHELTGQDDVLSKYGFDGTGQTVAVLDTGIAYEHYALGGGLGEGYRVVGGFDVTENDADFYDDGPTGGHGTHVAGIIGADGDGSHSGVATGVDLVGIRVFDDAGNGYFSWVEQGLNWVYDNRNAFESPITAVNLSLGTEWNSDSIPSWAMLEDEFAKLESVGIFIAISAGNSYQDYNQNGVSYPAASDHVIPVMATYNSGGLASFSQRAEYAIAAPGVSITSTVPDYAANDGDSIDDDWLSMSGTSMASPYVAGASVLIREAMAFVGQTGVDQWDIYDHMMNTADSFFDSTSQTNYKRLNLEAAIDALMPEDDYGSTVAMAHSVGTLTEGSDTELSGVVSTLDDEDHFAFTAGVSGVVTVSASNVTHNLTAEWDALGGTWQIDADGNCVIDVVAGQTYTIALSSADGLGYYDLSIDIESTAVPAIDWGVGSTQETRIGLSVAGEQDYTIVAKQSGYFTAEIFTQQGSATVAIYDAQGNQVSPEGTRSDVMVDAGDTLTLRVAGESEDFSLRLTNALSIEGEIATLVGTAADDTVTFQAGTESHKLSLNGVEYAIDTASVQVVKLEGEVGDAVTFHGTEDAESVWLNATSASFEGESYAVEAIGFSVAHAISGGGDDIARIYDSAGNDAYEAWSDRTEMLLSTGERLTTSGFSQNWAFASEGYDVARLNDSAGDDLLRAYHDKATIIGDDYFNYTRLFDEVWSYATTGYDQAQFFDSAGDDTFRAYHDKAMMSAPSAFYYARMFDTTTAHSTSGNDVAMFYDSEGDDLYYGYADRARMQGVGYENEAYGFGETIAYSTSGTDIARLYDSIGDDSLFAYHDRSVLSGSGFSNEARSFDQVWAYASGGQDIARLYDSAGDDLLRAYHDKAMMSGEGFYNYARAFDQTWSYASGGNDVARIYGTAGDDILRVYHDKAMMAGSLTFNYARTFDQVFAVGGGGGDDLALFYDSVGDDTLTASGTTATMQTPDYSYTGTDFDRVSATRSSGEDTAIVEATDFALETFGGWS